jgi:hypothetical protein
MVELCSHSPIRLHGVVLNCLIKHRDTSTVTSHVLLGHYHYMHSLGIALTYAVAADHTSRCSGGLAMVQLTLDVLLN